MGSTSEARVRIGNKRHRGVETGNHLRITPHFVQRDDPQVGLSQARGGGARAGLEKNSEF